MWLPPCIFYKLTGLYCPGCGTGRALRALLEADVVTAFRMNPLGFILVPVATILYFARPQVFRTRWMPIVLLLVLVGYAVLRNIPCYPFTLLAPLPAS